MYDQHLSLAHEEEFKIKTEPTIAERQIIPVHVINIILPSNQKEETDGFSS